MVAFGRRHIKKAILRVLDIVFSPIIFFSIYGVRYLRRLEISNPPLRQYFPIAKRICEKLGVFIVVDHYYEPLFRREQLRHSLRRVRRLPGIDMNDDEQLSILERFNYNDELLCFPLKGSSDIEYGYRDGAFLYGDSEYLYNMIRHFKPKKIIEIGSGHSTLMALNAISKNREESQQYSCEHTCIEPYECKWLEKTGVAVIRQKVETLDPSFFSTLGVNDILFIDSSHIIRPQGDVLFEYLEVLPMLKSGVICHIHDIFTPADYLDEWLGEKLWNEQYLLEAFLSLNKYFRIIGATNYLSHTYSDQFEAKCPVYAQLKEKELASFWIQRN